MAGVEVDLPWPEYPRADENVAGEFSVEVLAQVSTVEVEEIGVSTFEHSGGLVVLR